jgi:hypothetical protein
MLLDAFLLNELLSRDIASSEEESSGNALSEQWTSGQSGVVPRLCQRGVNDVEACQNLPTNERSHGDNVLLTETVFNFG